MNQSSIPVLQLCHLAGATRAQARAVLHHCRQLVTQAEPEFRVSTVVVTTRRRRADDLVQLAEGLGIDFHQLAQHGPVDPSVWWRLRRLIRRLGVRLIHAHDSKSYRLALLLQPLCGFRMVASAEPSSADDWKKWITREVDRKLLPGFDRVIAANDQLAWQLCQLGCRARQIDVIHKGVDTETFSRQAVSGDARTDLRVSAGAYVVGAYLNRDEPDLQLLFDAVQLAEVTMGPMHLVLLGDRSAAYCARRLAIEYRRTDRTRWLGARDDRPEIYTAMDLFIAGGGEMGPSSELLEAQSMEVPAISIRSKGAPQWIEPGTTGLLVDPDRTDLLGQAIVQLLQNRREAELMASAGRLRICQRFRASERLKHIAATYRRAINQA